MRKIRSSAVAAVTGCAALVATAAGAVPAGATGDGGAASTGGTSSAKAAAGGDTYTNPVTQGYSIDFPDPAVIRGKDGNWYAFSTGGPYDEQGKENSSYKIAKSPDLVHWSDAGDVFPEGSRPEFATERTGFWAPDIRYLNGQYLLYFTVPNTTTSDARFDPAIGVATAPTPSGPWKPAAEPLIDPRRNPAGGWDTTIDPALFTDTDGTHYMYWGGYGTGLWVVELSDDGTRAITEPKHIASHRFEGPNVMHRNGWYYMFASSANCCAGPTTGYTVFVGRSRSPLGPFEDKQGASMLDSRTGGTPVIAQNGNKWIGVGHHSAATDLSGQTYMNYHAIDRNDPWLDVAPGFTMRGMNVDRMDWIDGWPIVRAGKGPSDDPQPAPVMTGEVDDNFSDKAATTSNFPDVEGKLTVAGPDEQSDSGHFGRLAPDTTALTKKLTARDVRVEADVRTADKNSVGVVARDDVRAVIDPAAQELRLEAGSTTEVVSIPEGFDYGAWHVLALEVRGQQVTANVTDARLGDPWAIVSAEVSPTLTEPGRAGVTGGGEVDNFSANELYRPTKRTVDPPKRGDLEAGYSDEFDGKLGDGWSWLRKDDKASVQDGNLAWPTQTKDLVGNGKPGLLLREEMPEGEYTVQTKLTLDIGKNVNRNFQQGGLIVYDDDDNFLRHDVVAVGKTRIVEFGKEMVFDGRRSWGGAVIGPPGKTTWLRLHHSRHPETNEHLFRAASSNDGEHWTWGATWTLPADSDPKIGLVSQGSQPYTTDKYGPALSQFEYFRVHQRH